jgi:hypothetical protein
MTQSHIKLESKYENERITPPLRVQLSNSKLFFAPGRRPIRLSASNRSRSMMQTAHLENLKVRLLFDLWRVVVMNYQSLSSQTRLALRGDDPLDHLDLAASMLSATWS